MRQFNLLIVAAMTASLAGCGGGPKSGKGFTLPEGNAERGKAVFIKLSCHECHTVSGVELPRIEDAAEKQVRIGGEVSRIQTYGELVTSLVATTNRRPKGVQKIRPTTQCTTDDAGEHDATTCESVHVHQRDRGHGNRVSAGRSDQHLAAEHGRANRPGVAIRKRAPR